MIPQGLARHSSLVAVGTRGGHMQWQQWAVCWSLAWNYNNKGSLKVNGQEEKRVGRT